MSPQHVVITGMMGVGKSTTAAAAATALSAPLRDSDEDIMALFGQSGNEIAESQGVPALHTIEAAVLIGSLGSAESTVISAAASVIENEACTVAMARRSFVVFLEASVDEVVKRAATGIHRRTIDSDEVGELMARRTPFFHDCADLVLDATRPTEELSESILRALAASRSESPSAGAI